MLELLVVVALMGALAAMAIMVSPSFTRTARADASIVQMMDAIRSAREVAISQRRNVELRFVGLDAIQTVRIDIGADGVQTGTTILRTVELENRMQFRLEPDVTDDTPDGFGNATATHFGVPAATQTDIHQRGHVRGPGRRRAQRDGVPLDSERGEQRASDHDYGCDGAGARVAMERQRVGGVSHGNET